MSEIQTKWFVFQTVSEDTYCTRILKLVNLTPDFHSITNFWTNFNLFWFRLNMLEVIEMSWTIWSNLHLTDRQEDCWATTKMLQDLQRVTEVSCT